jgi:Leucine-rich repeat (LRR) protein
VTKRPHSGCVRYRPSSGFPPSIVGNSTNKQSNYGIKVSMPSSNRNALAEAERRIAEAKRTRETALILSDLGLEVLPENVCRLAHLRSLYLNDNRLTQLPESIGRLAQLQRLSLLGNRLTQLPRCVGHLARLESLRLSRNRLTQLPKSIGQLARFKESSPQ